MLLWLENNLGTIVVAAILVLIVGLVIRGLILDRRAGKTSCGSNCGGCALAGKCHASGQCPSGGGEGVCPATEALLRKIEREKSGKC
ncbi:MAG: FeoB-associated Cys-rich membrane protein [Lachnospiraceae bacterium]|nr:FeoB-associated Cys-rich membrane protein [Lachnospiraceae bacterium]